MSCAACLARGYVSINVLDSDNIWNIFHCIGAQKQDVVCHTESRVTCVCSHVCFPSTLSSLSETILGSYQYSTQNNGAKIAVIPKVVTFGSFKINFPVLHSVWLMPGRQSLFSAVGEDKRRAVVFQMGHFSFPRICQWHREKLCQFIVWDRAWWCCCCVWLCFLVVDSHFPSTEFVAEGVRWTLKLVSFGAVFSPDSCTSVGFSHVFACTPY